MRLHRRTQPRRGVFLVLAVFGIIAVMGIIALAIDTGLLAMARSHCQNAADSAALAGVRRLNGDYTGSVNGRFSEVQGAATTMLQSNKVLNRGLLDANPVTGQPNGTVSTQVGVYLYDDVNQKFVQDFSTPGPTPMRDATTNEIIAWSLVKSTVTYSFPTFLAKGLWNAGPVNITTTAAAVHRPRDIAVVVDFSGSMGFDSTLGVPWSGARARTNNPDRAFPRFGGYAYAYQQSTGTNNTYDMWQRTTPNSQSGRSYSMGNLTVNPSTVDGSFLDAPAIVDDFYTGAAGSLTKAWPSSNFPNVPSNSAAVPGLTFPPSGASGNQFQDLPGGDNYLLANMNSSSATAYAKHVQDLTGTSTTTAPRPLATSSNDYDFEIFGYSFPGFTASHIDGFPAPGTAKSNFLSTILRGTGSDPMGRTASDFAGFTQGPRYWGKTFFIWPPDPRKPITSAPRLVRSGNKWVKNTTVGALNLWLAEMDRNWLLFPNGTPPASGSFSNRSVTAMTRYSAGAWDPLLANWPLDETGARRSTYWTRNKVERFLRGLDPNDSSTTRPASLNSLATYTTSGTRTFRAAPTAPTGVSYIQAGFYSGPGLNPATGSPAAIARYPEIDWNNRTTASENSINVDETSLTPATATVQPNPNGSNVDAIASVPSPLLLLPTDAIPTDGAPTGASTVATTDAQLARLILGLYDNIEANYDWRNRYVESASSSAQWPNDSTLFNTANLKVPSPSNSSSGYWVDYDSILYWIKNVGPNPFPSSLVCGRVRYYNSIPNTIPAGSTSMSDDERFWKEYIDFVLHVRQQGAGNNSYTDYSTYCGYGSDFTWGSAAINGPPSPTTTSADDARYYNTLGTVVNPNSLGNGYSRKGASVHYANNPPRPKCRLWFGPMTMVDFIINTNLGNPFDGPRVGSMAPGSCSQSQSLSCKLGVCTALLDCKQNHPNDQASLIFFSGTDMNSADPKRFRHVRAPLGRDYNRMIDALFFPMSTLDAGGEISWNSGEMNEVPNANGGTCYDLALMLAYNQFSSNSTLQTANGTSNPRGDAGGLGRKGAQKIVIFETDGVPNTACAVPALQGTGASNKFYPVRLSDSITISGGSNAWNANNFQTVAQKLASTTSLDGYSTTNKPLLIHAIGFGFLFESGYSPASEQTNALAALASLQSNGNVDDTADTADIFPGSSIASYKIITGNSNQRVSKMQQAFTRILQEKTVQVSLVQ